MLSVKMQNGGNLLQAGQEGGVQLFQVRFFVLVIAKYWLEWSWHFFFTFKNPGVLLLNDIWKLALRLIQSKLFSLRRGIINSFRPSVTGLQFSAQESVINRMRGPEQALTQPTIT